MLYWLKLKFHRNLHFNVLFMKLYFVIQQRKTFNKGKKDKRSYGLNVSWQCRDSGFTISSLFNKSPDFENFWRLRLLIRIVSVGISSTLADKHYEGDLKTHQRHESHHQHPTKLFSLETIIRIVIFPWNLKIPLRVCFKC